MPLTDAEKKLLDELKAKEGDPEEEQHKKRVAWIDKQIKKDEEDEAKRKADEDKKKKFRL